MCAMDGAQGVSGEGSELGFPTHRKVRDGWGTGSSRRGDGQLGLVARLVALDGDGVLELHCFWGGISGGKPLRL